MLTAVIKKELLGHIVSARFLICSVLLVILAILAAMVGTNDYLLRHDQYEEQEEAEQLRLKRATVYSDLRPLMSREPQPLSVFDRGFEDRLGDQVRISIDTIPLGPRKVDRKQSFLTSFRSLDLTTLVRLILGLLAFLLTFNALVGERENGNLKLVLAQGLSRTTFLSGKLFGALAALSIPLIASVLVSLWILVTRGDVELGGALVTRVLALVVGYLAYLTVLLLLGLLLSAKAPHSSSALAVSLLAWLVIVFLVPQAAVAVAAEVARPACEPWQLRGELDALEAKAEAERNAVYDDLPILEDSAHMPPRRDPGRLYRFASGEAHEALVEYHSAKNEIDIWLAEERFAVEHRCAGGVRRAERMAHRLAFVSPAYLLERISEAFAGTSVASFDDFFSDARDYREKLIDFLHSREALHTKRWFTDDGLPWPWTGFLGLYDPSQITTDEELKGFQEAYKADEVQDRVRAVEKVFNEDPKRRVSEEEILDFERTVRGVPGEARRVVFELVGFVILVACLWFLVNQSFHRVEVG